MTPTEDSKDLPRTGSRRGKRLAATALAGALLVGCLSTPAATGAWFSAAKSTTNNTATASTLQAVSGLQATKASDGVNVSWNSALQQPWATANFITTAPTYTVTRTIDGANPTTITTGTSTTATDPYPKGTTTIPTTFDAGQGVAGYVKDDGSVVMWGKSDSGSLGSPYTTRPYPQAVTFPAGTPPIVSLTMDNYSVLAISSDGTLWGWGTASRAGCKGEFDNYPVQIALPGGTKAAAATPVGNCAVIVLDASGVLWQRGGTASSGTFARTGTSFQKITLPGNRSVAQLAKREMVVATDGTVWSWGGTNDPGTYGDGTQLPKDTPTQAKLPAGIQIESISTDDQNSVVALSNSRRVFAWGANSQGQLGTGNTNAVLTPVEVNVPGDSVVDVRTAGRTTTVLQRDGYVKTVGANYNGRLGIGRNTEEPSLSFVNAGQYSKSARIVMSTNPGGQTFVIQGQGLQTVDVYGWGLSSNDSSVSYFGNGDTTISYTYARRVQTNVTTASTSPRTSCGDGGTPTSNGLCPPAGKAEYAISYTYGSWISATAKAAAG